MATLFGATALAGTASAGGLDRSYQSVLAIFNDPGTVSFSLSYVEPDLKAEDINGTGRYDAADGFAQYQFSYTGRINDRFSYAIINDQPFGANIFYDDDPLTSNIGGTEADLETDAFTFIGKYDFDDRISVFGGPRVERASGVVALNGQAYARAIALRGVARVAGVDAGTLGAALQGDPNAVAALGGLANVGALGAQFQNASSIFLATGGYEVELDDDWGVGLTLGAAYEIPEIALRLAVTYHSEISHDNATTEQFGLASLTPIPSEIAFSSPQSVNVDFQTGLNERTLLIAGVRWTDWDDFDVIPTTLGSDLAVIDDSYRWSLGVARRLTDAFVGLATLTYEEDLGSETQSPLGPTDGLIGLTLGGRYTRDNLNVSGGVSYNWVGSANAGVAEQPVASLTDSSAIGVGFKVDYRF
ncbi:OmpP1/FadL family transporter [Jannaschia seosinensis]|nr:outer membrane protein transport protein [Jannaschia seosinensis]